MSANADLITVETYMHKGKQLKTCFSYIGQNVKKKPYFLAIWAPWFEGSGGIQWSDCASLSLQLSSHPYLCTCEAIWKELFFIFGGSWGALTSNPGLPNFQGSKTSPQSRQIYNKGTQITTSFFYIWPQCECFNIFGYWGGGVPGWPMDNETGPILLSSYPLAYNVHIHIKYGFCKLSRYD